MLVIKDLKLGEIERIDLISKKNDRGENFQRCFIHMKQWFKNVNAVKARDRLMKGLDIKVIYENPWFWKIFASRKRENNKEDIISITT